MDEGIYVYILKCADRSFYTGTARAGLERRITEHNSGFYEGYTSTRLPVKLVYSEWFATATDAIVAERRIKGWSRAKKQALIRGDIDALRELSRRGPHASRRIASRSSSA